METIFELIYPYRWELFWVGLIGLATKLYLLGTNIYLSRRMKVMDVGWLMVYLSKKSVPQGMLMILVAGPVVEELLFRMPLIVLCKDYATGWPAVLLTSIVFGLVHFGKVTPMPDDIRLAAIKYEAITAEQALNAAIADKKKHTSFARKLFPAASATVLGYVLGYLAVTHHSLWVVIGAHFLWNLLTLTVLPFLLMLVFVVGKPLWRAIYFRHTRP